MQGKILDPTERHFL